MDNVRGRRMPVVFSGHGSPMLALEPESAVAQGLRELGQRIRRDFGKPKAILAISAHWYVEGTYIQAASEPRQVYDMYGFPQELYEVKYPVSGCAELSGRVKELLGSRVQANDFWGIDHGTWTVLVHVFPEADVPVVQLSVDATLPPRDLRDIGRALAPLRDEGYLVFASGNIVHNLGLVDWEHPDAGSAETLAFNADVIAKVRVHDEDALLDYTALPHWKYAIPTPDHYLPLAYALGAADGDDAEVFNDICNLGSMSMTGFIFGA